MARAARTTEEVVKRLRRRGAHAPAAKLAALAVDDLLRRPLEELLVPAEVADHAMDVLRGLASSEELAQVVRARVSWWIDRLAEEPGVAGDWLDDEGVARLEELLERPFPLDPELTMRWLDHEAMRNLVRRVLRETLSTFARRVRPSIPDSRLLSSVKRRAGRLTRRQRERASSIGDGVLGAVSGEVERGMERRVGEFVDSAVGGVLRRIADHVTDPAHEGQFGRMRSAAARVALETSNRALAAEASKLDLEALAAFVVSVIRSAADNDRVAAWIGAAVEEEVRGVTCGQWLEERGMREAWSAWAREVLAERTRSLARTEEFAAWLDALLS